MEIIAVSHAINAIAQQTMHGVGNRALNLTSAEDSDLHASSEIDQDAGYRPRFSRTSTAVIDLVSTGAVEILKHLREVKYSRLTSGKSSH